MMASQQGQGHVVTLHLSMVDTFAPEEILIPTCVLDHIVQVLIVGVSCLIKPITLKAVPSMRPMAVLINIHDSLI